jgi:RNA 3'-terminal phosphate cyclase (ATP)
MLRNAVALSAVTGSAVRVMNIRGARPRPGLRPQHLIAVQAAAWACGADLRGAEIGSREIEFRPGELGARTQWRLDVGTAGSLTLVLQSLLPALVLAPEPSELTLIGGTDVPFAPPLDYFEHVFLPALSHLGPRVQVKRTQRGFYPKGGGRIEVQVGPVPSIDAVHWPARGQVLRLAGCSYSQGLPAHIAERMRSSALGALAEAGHRQAEVDIEIAERGPSEGCGIVLWAECDGGRRLGGSALGRRGRRAEQVGREAAQALLAELDSGSAVDSHLADQMIVWMALASGRSGLTAPRLTDHVRSAAAVAEAVAGASFSLEEGSPARVECRPAAGG